MDIKNVIYKFLAIIFMFLAASCSGADKSSNVDADMIYTQAAQTVEGQLTEAAAQLPTSTNTVPSTSTVLPSTPTIASVSSTGTPIPLFTMPSSGTMIAPLGTQLGGGATATVKVQVQGDKAEWYYSHPADSAKLSPGESFTFIVGMGNVGSTTWTSGYKMVHVGGTVITTQMSFNINKETLPGETGEFYMPAKAPGEAGSYTTYWQIVNESGAYVYESMYWQFYVE